tara:strand:- start:22 stop:699 length:678 start_codon:yes stop_codon:yes gene_type:complete
MSDGIQKKENLDVVDGWMGTYGDMVTLLMAFFVLLYAFSDPDPGKMGELSSALNSALTNEEVKNEFKGLEKQLEEIVEDAELTEEVEISQTIKGIEIQMEGSTLYESCSADVNEDMAPVIANISKTITDILSNSEYTGYIVEVVGHTDNIPPTTCEYFDTNFDLSAYRATQVVNLLIDAGIEKSKLRAIGMADAEPLAPNTDENGKPIKENQAKNRRVEILINKF